MAHTAEYRPGDYGSTVAYPNAGDLSAPLFQPPSQDPMSREGLSALEKSNGFMIRQKLQLMEELIPALEQRNRYKVSPLPPEYANRTPNDDEFDAMPSMMEVREQSTFCCRYCCGNKREMTLGFFPPDIPNAPAWPVQEPLFQIFRPFKWTIPCCFCVINPQEFHVSSKGADVGKLVQHFRCVDSWFKCTHWAQGFDAAGNHVFSFKAPFWGENCCAPSCFNDTFTISVVDAHSETNVLSKLKNIWPGWTFRGLCGANADNYVVEFPQGATNEQKALILGALFYHDFQYFEKEKKGNN